MQSKVCLFIKKGDVRRDELRRDGGRNREREKKR
jgi:hypothetical protein